MLSGCKATNAEFKWSYLVAGEPIQASPCAQRVFRIDNFLPAFRIFLPNYFLENYIQLYLIFVSYVTKLRIIYLFNYLLIYRKRKVQNILVRILFTNYVFVQWKKNYKRLIVLGIENPLYSVKGLKLILF